MKPKKKQKILFILIALVCVIFLFSSLNVVHAEINSEYTPYDDVTDVGLDDAIGSSTLLELIAKLVYAVGRFLEWILGTIFTMLTGTSDFPWADKIVFNAVPLLDVNFINPAKGSFVGGTSIQAVLKSLYATMLAIAVSFFGITVMITAIKLVISTIASEKAKYKQAVVDWVTGLVMLFCMHFFISFIFYLNEQLVVVASKVVTSQLQGVESVVVHVQQSTVGNQLIEKIKSSGAVSADDVKLLEDNATLLNTWMNLASNDSSKGLQEGLMKNIEWWSLGLDVASADKSQQYKNLVMIIRWAVDSKISASELTEIKNNLKVFEVVYSNTVNPCPCVLIEPDYDSYQQCVDFNGCEVKKYAQAISASDLYKIFGFSYTNITNELQVTEHKASVKSGTSNIVISDESSNTYYYFSSGAEKLGSSYRPDNVNTNFYWTNVIDDLIRLKGASGTYVNDNGEVVKIGGSYRLLSDLASYFRYNAYNKELRSPNTTGLKDGGNARIENMLMYAILVVQSLILFIAYIKRLFYVVVLALMSPLVVVYDFFQRFGK